jgi:hypothetical protein
MRLKRLLTWRLAAHNGNLTKWNGCESPQHCLPRKMSHRKQQCVPRLRLDEGTTTFVSPATCLMVTGDHRGRAVAAAFKENSTLPLDCTLAVNVTFGNNHGPIRLQMVGATREVRARLAYV